jgi:shikimate 5-dehydrogenase
LLARARELDLPVVAPEDCEVVINCTPLGLAPKDPLPLDPGQVSPGAVALDLVYRRGETSWVRALRERGCRAADGRVVLVEQGAASFERWFPGAPAPREVMYAAVRAALE